MKNTSTTDGSASEHERLLAEAVALDRRGKVNRAQLAALEARIQKAIEEDDQRLAERIAELGQQSAVATRPPSRAGRLVAFAAVVYALAGALFELTLGANFVFAFGAKYWLAAPWIFFGALVPCMALMLRAEARQRLKVAYPTWAVRWLLMFPLATGLMAGLVVLATPGWAALLGRVAGVHVVERQARVVSVDRFSKSAKGCDQTAKLLVNDDVVGLCLEGRMAGPAPAAGEQVLLVGRASWFGLSVEEIRRR